MRPRYLLGIWILIVFLSLGLIGVWIYRVDPFFHFHRPDTGKYYYSIDNARSQNDGICKNFEYDAVITGTSMTQNFKTSEADALFGVNSIKVPYAGASYKEVNDCIRAALSHNADIKMVIRGLDMTMFYDSADQMRENQGVSWPTYLYDDNPLNDIKYLYNRDVVWGRALQMEIDRRKEGFNPGITSFDDCYSWQSEADFGRAAVLSSYIKPNLPGPVNCDQSEHLTEDEKQRITDNICRNITSTADEYPDTDFYCFFTPYSYLWWCEQYANASSEKQLEAETYIIELLLGHENIHLFSFNTHDEITMNLDNYKDYVHYGEKINSRILEMMRNNESLLTSDNYSDYIESESELYSLENLEKKLEEDGIRITEGHLE